MQQRPTKFCCCVYNPQLDTQCTTTVNHGGILKNAQKVHVKEEDSWMVGLCIRPDAKLHDGGFYVSCRSKKCTGGDFSRIKSSVRPQEVKYEAQNVEPPPPPYTPSPPTSDPPPCPPYLAYLVLHASQFNGRTSRPLHVRELRSCWFCYFKRTDEWHKFYDRTK